MFTWYEYVFKFQYKILTLLKLQWAFTNIQLAKLDKRGTAEEWNCNTVVMPIHFQNKSFQLNYVCVTHSAKIWIVVLNFMLMQTHN